ncbi:hypothetical protein [Burkholderia cenocepacia]|uniref:hypothetical protein n=1 Tax=Burkholderia cenocepacia TaxID=95486 RepID=UPI000761754E|nr:hypothetical protein [Burkholderia cenocepacia]KWU26316.1 hypothetical protein AS149_25330 [Burkholderia cenocepacia]
MAINEDRAVGTTVSVRFREAVAALETKGVLRERNPESELPFRLQVDEQLLGDAQLTREEYMLECNLNGTVLEVKEALMSFTDTKVSYWYYDIHTWLRSLTGKPHDMPSQPMSPEEIEWVRTYYLPKALAPKAEPVKSQYDPKAQAPLRGSLPAWKPTTSMKVIRARNVQPSGVDVTTHCALPDRSVL